MSNPVEYDAVVHALGDVARELGGPKFHLRLLELVGVFLPHESAWIVRYSPKQLPDVLYTKEISQAIIRYYLETEPSATDPYFCSWRTNAAARIEPLAIALPMALDQKFYSLDFMKKMEFTDELAIFFPSFGTSCLSLFFERKSERFANDDIARIQKFLPTLLDFHHAHTRSLLTSMSAVSAGLASIEDSVAGIFESCGKRVFATQKWHSLAANSEPFRSIENAQSCEEIQQLAENASTKLRVIPLDPMNSIAPGGLLLHLMNDNEFLELASDRAAAAIFEQLTPRERDIVALAFEGLSTGAAAQRLFLSKGSIKNCRLRIYRKFGVSSEREMITKLMPISKHLMLRLTGGTAQQRKESSSLLMSISLGDSSEGGDE